MPLQTWKGSKLEAPGVAAPLEEAAKASTSKFTEEFRKHAPSYLANPSYPTDFVPHVAEAEASAEVPAAIKLSFTLPHVSWGAARGLSRQPGRPTTETALCRCQLAPVPRHRRR